MPSPNSFLKKHCLDVEYTMTSHPVVWSHKLSQSLMVGRSCDALTSAPLLFSDVHLYGRCAFALKVWHCQLAWFAVPDTGPDPAPVTVMLPRPVRVGSSTRMWQDVSGTWAKWTPRQSSCAVQRYLQEEMLPLKPDCPAASTYRL